MDTKKHEKLKKKYGTYLYEKGIELLGEENPESKKLEETIENYLLSDELFEMLREKHAQLSDDKEVFQTLNELKNLKHKKLLILSLVRILEE